MAEPGGVSSPLVPIVVLPARCERPVLESLRAELLRALTGPRVELDAGDLTHIDAGGMQLLCALARTAASRSIAVTWNRPAPVLIATASTLGVLRELGLVGPDGG